MEVNKESVIKALAYAGIAELPSEATDEQGQWINAIGLTERRDGSKTFVILGLDDNLQPKVIKDFYLKAGINKLLSIYPYYFLREEYTPKFKPQDKNSRVSYLEAYSPNSGKVNFLDMTLAQLKMEITKLSIYKQITDERKRNLREN